MSKAKTAQLVSRTDHVQEITNQLQRLHQHYGPWEVFGKFLDLCHLCLDELPDNLDRAIKKEPMVETEAYKELAAGIRPDDIKVYAQCFGMLLQDTTGPDGELTYRDTIGSAYMLLGSANKWAGQYFTPQNVADCMAMMVMGDMAGLEKEFSQRLAAATEDDPILKCLGLTAALVLGAAGKESLKEAGEDWARTRFLPLVMHKIEPFRICDPCVGSGVMLLSAAKACPRWLIDIGFVQFYGMDIDATCVSMCRLNMRLYGIEKMKLSDASIEKVYGAPPPYDELYERVRIAKEAGDTEQESECRELVTQARQMAMFSEAEGVA